MDAYRSSRKTAPNVRRLIFAAINYGVEQGLYGLTCDEAQVHIPMEHQTCSAEWSTMAKEGVIVITGIKRQTRLKRGADVYRVAAIPVDPNMPRQEAMNMGQE